MDRTVLPLRRLDVLRACAVLLVLLDHLLTYHGWQLPELSNWSLGRLGVLLFFVHTSLVLMSSIERHGTQSGWVHTFYLRRAFRIYPLAIVTVLVAILFTIPPHVVPQGAPNIIPPLTPRVLIGNMTLTQNLIGADLVQGVLWSLPLEVQMYVLLPGCYLFARKGPSWVLGLMGLSLGAFWVVGHIESLWRLNLAYFAPVFLLGVLAFAIFRTRSLRDMPASRLTRIAHTIATYSYGVYLLHTPVLWLAFRVLHATQIIQWLAFGVLMIVLPWIGYHVIESPMINFGARLTQSQARVVSDQVIPNMAV